MVKHLLFSFVLIEPLEQFLRGTGVTHKQDQIDQRSHRALR